MTLHICWGPPMVERKRELWETRWCFKCRKHLPHDAVLLVQDPATEPSYMGDPRWRVECHGCGGDHVHFPGCQPDGPTLEVAW
jgi:hypothetical protein